MNDDDIQIKWMTEPGGPGAQVSSVLRIAADRIATLDAVLPCQENCDALRAIWDAIGHLTARTERRRAQGVEGSHQPHFSVEHDD